jgi:hypothetical protein
MAELGGENEHEGGFFVTLPTPVGLVAGLELLGEAAALGKDLPGDNAQGAAAEALAALVERQVIETTVQTAKISEEAIREHIAKTRVRPDYENFGGMFQGFSPGSGRKRLEDAIKSDALGLGAVGIASIEKLDTVVGLDGRPFWRTQEFGSTHNVGRVVYGLFQPGGSLPSQQQFRQHPVFIAGQGGPMRIERPIPARHFLRDGAGVAEGFRERLFADTQNMALGEIRAIRATLIAL